MNNCKMLIKEEKATTMCMYVAHWNIFMVNKRDLQQQQNSRSNYSLLLYVNGTYQQAKICPLQ